VKAAESPIGFFSDALWRVLTALYDGDGSGAGGIANRVFGVIEGGLPVHPAPCRDDGQNAEAANLVYR
jgi:hypothetical protein